MKHKVDAMLFGQLSDELLRGESILVIGKAYPNTSSYFLIVAVLSYSAMLCFMAMSSVKDSLTILFLQSALTVIVCTGSMFAIAVFAVFRKLRKTYLVLTSDRILRVSQHKVETIEWRVAFKKIERRNQFIYATLNNKVIQIDCRKSGEIPQF